MAKILVVDDEHSILETLQMFLEEKGLQVFTADTGEKGLLIFEQEHPQTVILDIRLPDGNGLDVLKSMMEKQVPSKIIMITADRKSVV